MNLYVFNKAHQYCATVYVVAATMEDAIVAYKNTGPPPNGARQPLHSVEPVGNELIMGNPKETPMTTGPGARLCVCGCGYRYISGECRNL